MQLRTHFTTSLAIGLPLMATTGTLNSLNILIFTAGVLFPDINEESSWIGCRIRKVSKFISKAFSQKELTHSIFGYIVVLMTIVLLVNILHVNVVGSLYFLFGYLLHLLEDSFSKNGIRWLEPFSNQSFRTGKDVFYYVIGGRIESIILFASTFIVGIESLLFYF